MNVTKGLKIQLVLLCRNTSYSKELPIKENGVKKRLWLRSPSGRSLYFSTRAQETPELSTKLFVGFFFIMLLQGCWVIFAIGLQFDSELVFSSDEGEFEKNCYNFHWVLKRLFTSKHKHPFLVCFSTVYCICILPVQIFLVWFTF